MPVASWLRRQRSLPQTQKNRPDGQVTSDSFEDGRFLDADILALIGKMTIAINSDYSVQAPGLRNCRIEAELESGEKLVAHHALSQAEIERETPDDVIAAKFHGLTRRLLPGQRARRAERGDRPP